MTVFAIITVLLNLTKSLIENEEDIQDLLRNCKFDGQKVLLHLNEIGVRTETKEETDQIVEQILSILSDANLYPEVKYV